MMQQRLLLSDKDRLRYLAAANAHRPHADGVVGVAGEKGRAVGRPAEGDAVVDHRLLANRGELGGELVDDGFRLQIPDLDARVGGGAKPIAVGREDHRMDDGVRLKRVEVLALVEIPQHGGAVLSTGRAERAVRGDGHGVQVSGVANQVGAQLAVGEVPDLDQLVPAARHDQWVSGRRREAHARHPLGVAILLDRVLALAERVPQLDRLVACTRDDLAVVSREGHGEHILLVLVVARKPTRGGAGVEVPKAERAVPRARERKLTVRGDGHVLHIVRVAFEGPAGGAVVLTAVEGPDDDRLVAGAGKKHIRLFHGGGEARDPVVVGLEGSAENERFSHGCRSV
mmetsp:Transcript_7944/g.20778  ORF Transcript_7944/g.20778 Transcript_7944/m.20778 type:complete len:342 (+) Transcript_7944:66-1091(+)